MWKNWNTTWINWRFKVPYPSEHSCRLKPPGRGTDYEWARTPRETHDTHKGYIVIRRKRKPDGSWEDQAFRYPRDRWTAEQAQSHCSAHDGSFEAARPQGNEKWEILKSNTVQFAVNLPVRHEIFESRPHLVAPVVALVEGVHNEIFYPGEEIGKYVNCWNGVPLPVFHTSDYGKYISANTPHLLEERSVGRFFFAQFDPNGGKLKGELWVDIEKAKKISPEVLELIQSNGQLEVSTALWLDEDGIPGNWHGEQFASTARNYRPDHIALLPGGEGACNWMDGCGVRANQGPGSSDQGPENIKNGGEMENEKKGKLKVLIQQIKDLFREESPVRFQLTSNEMSHEDLRTKIQRALDALDNQGWVHFVKAIYDDFVIYEAKGTNPNEIGAPGSQQAVKLYKRGYSIGSEEDITLKDDPQEVREVTEYVPVEQLAGNAKANEKKNPKTEVTVDKKKEKIDALIACNCTRFKEEDRVWLESLPEERLETLKAVDPPKAPEPPTPPSPNAAKPPEKKEEPPKPVTLEEFIGNAPPEIQGVLTRAVDRDKAVKDQLVEELVKNDRCKFSKEELEAKDIGELGNLATLAQVEVDFTGAGGGPAANQDKKVPDMPSSYVPAATTK